MVVVAGLLGSSPPDNRLAANGHEPRPNPPSGRGGSLIVSAPFVGIGKPPDRVAQRQAFLVLVRQSLPQPIFIVTSANLHCRRWAIPSASHIQVKSYAGSSCI